MKVAVRNVIMNLHFVPSASQSMYKDFKNKSLNLFDKNLVNFILMIVLTWVFGL